MGESKAVRHSAILVGRERLRFSNRLLHRFIKARDTRLSFLDDAAHGAVRQQFDRVFYRRVRAQFARHVEDGVGTDLRAQLAAVLSRADRTLRFCRRAGAAAGAGSLPHHALEVILAALFSGLVVGGLLLLFLLGGEFVDFGFLLGVGVILLLREFLLGVLLLLLFLLQEIFFFTLELGFFFLLVSLLLFFLFCERDIGLHHRRFFNLRWWRLDGFGCRLRWRRRRLGWFRLGFRLR